MIDKVRKRTFKKKDYYSGDGMLTTVWGPSMWHFLHTMSFNYPVAPTEDDKKHYREFMLSLQYILPCKYCRQNLTKNYKVFPLRSSDMAGRESFSRYVYKLHEMVNKMLKKTIGFQWIPFRALSANAMNIFDRVVQTKNPNCLILRHSKIKHKKKKKRGVQSRFMGRNRNVLLKSCHRKRNVRRCRSIRNVSRKEHLSTFVKVPPNIPFRKVSPNIPL